ncbi:MAG: hypothetical protein AAB779_01860, partial [Patescibacteria group bacterium]
LGIAGLGLSFSIAALLNLFLLWVYLHRRLGNLDDSHIMRSTLVISLLSIVAGWALYAVLYLVAPEVDTHTALGLTIQAVAGGVVGLTVYLVLAKLVGLEEIKLKRNTQS